MNAEPKSTVVYGQTVDRAGFRVRVLGVYGYKSGISDKRFVSIELSRDGDQWTKGVDVDPAMLEELLPAIARACKAERR